MKETIEADDFCRNLILLVTLKAMTDSKRRRIHNCSLPTDQLRPVVADVSFHTSQLSLAIPSQVGAIGTTNGDSDVTA